MPFQSSCVYDRLCLCSESAGKGTSIFLLAPCKPGEVTGDMHNHAPLAIHTELSPTLLPSPGSPSPREKTLRSISLTYQQFQNSNENLMFWMNSLPKHQVKTTDGPSQINYKLQAQKVSHATGPRTH